MLLGDFGLWTPLAEVGPPDYRVHPPNGKLNLDGLRAGTRTAAALWGGRSRACSGVLDECTMVIEVATMTVQTLTIGKRRFVVVPERDFRRLEQRAEREEVRPEVIREAKKELRQYRKTGKAKTLEQVKRELGL